MKRHLKRLGIQIKSRLDKLGSFVVELPLSTVQELLTTAESSYLSLDRPVEMLGHLEETTGAALIRQSLSNTNITGKGVGIAVLDSGIFTNHKAFVDSQGTPARLLASVDLTGQGVRTNDPYGHGTHVSGLVAGQSLMSISPKYRGIAPEANLINLRVLDSQGRGTTSSVLSALDWVLANHLNYNIRVVNMSLGTLAVDSYINDPLCRAVRRLVDAGIICVTAAGNNGKDSLGQKLYGLIHSPGNEPSAITVGATNSFGTDIRNDDVMATYSSRGPTRSYWTDQLGEKHYDNLIKPDLVAPGNRLIAAQSEDSTLIASHPELNAVSKNDSEKELMYLSGTSMSAPVVAGAAALMLQVNPNLTPNMVKVLLMYTAQPLAGFNMFEQGAGALNIEGAVRLAKLVRNDLTNATTLGTSLLTTTTLPTPQTTITGQTFSWGQGIIIGSTYATGTELITRYQVVYGTGLLLNDGILLSDGHLLSNATVFTNGVSLGSHILTSDGHLLSNGLPFLAVGDLYGDGHLLSNGVVLVDGVLMSDGHLLSNTNLLIEAILQANTAQISGDPGGM
jgi:subtilisin family serine protease